MSGILYLSTDDFIVKKGEKGNLLCLNYEVNGLSLVWFYSNECQHCKKLMGCYKQLPFNINGCQFTMINVNKPENRRVVQMASQTIVPITYVPDIILYVDGLPYMRYDGKHDIPNIKQFILEMSQQLQKTSFYDSKKSQQPQQVQQQQVQQQQVQQQRPPQTTTTKQTIPAYTIGKPKCSGDRDDVCYLSFNQAYTQ